MEKEVELEKKVGQDETEVNGQVDVEDVIVDDTVVEQVEKELEVDNPSQEQGVERVEDSVDDSGGDSSDENTSSDANSDNTNENELLGDSDELQERLLELEKELNRYKEQESKLESTIREKVAREYEVQTLIDGSGTRDKDILSMLISKSEIDIYSEDALKEISKKIESIKSEKGYLFLNNESIQVGKVTKRESKRTGNKDARLREILGL